MYTDSFMNFSRFADAVGDDAAAESISLVAAGKPLLVLDTGSRPADIWERADRVRSCLELVDDDGTRRAAGRMFYFAAGIAGDAEAVENRFSLADELEENISLFRSSDDEFAARLVALGPCGIDHDWEGEELAGSEHSYFDSRTVEDERDLFALQLTLAKKLSLPAVISSRKGFRDTADVMKAVKWGSGVVHGYSYTKDELDFFLDMGYFISFGGTVTYGGRKGFSDMAEAVAYVPKDRLLLESGSPFYAPVPVRTGVNSPENIKFVYEYVAAKRGISGKKLSEIVDENARSLFHI